MMTGWCIPLMMAMIILPGWGQAQPEKHYSITPRLIARTLSNRGMETQDEQVALTAQVVATEPYPSLEVLSVEPQAAGEKGESRSVVKLACRTPAVCLPFFAFVSGPQTAVTPAMLPSNAISGGLNIAGLPAGPRAKTDFTIRAGTHAVLFMDDKVAHIQVAVVSLENGDTGKWIRVASPDHKQFYRGEVLNANQLQGEF